jgi:hypothetical protein
MLRKTYGQASQEAVATKGSSVTYSILDEPSLMRLIHDHDAGNLDKICERLVG